MANKCVMEAPKEESRVDGKCVEEIRAGKISNFMKTINAPIHESQVTSNIENIKKSTPWNIFKLLKNSDEVKSLKVDIEKRYIIFEQR